MVRKISSFRWVKSQFSMGEKSPFLIGKPSINGPFSMAMYGEVPIFDG